MAAKAPRPPAPKGAGPAGRKLWADVTGKYELEQHELTLLKEAARCADELDRLHEIVQAEGLVVTGPHGTKAHPALGAAKELRLVLARVLATLRLPAGDEDSPGGYRRPQRRSGVRGVYQAGSSF